jgi:hypothetical protein
LEHIPLKDDFILSDNLIYNIEPLRFSTVSIDSGFAELPILVPGNLREELTLSSPLADGQSRSYYSVCSDEFIFRAENLRIGAPRKMFMAVVAQVLSSPDLRLIRGEQVLMIISRSALLETGNYAGYKADDTSVIALYRLPNKPLLRI